VAGEPDSVTGFVVDLKWLKKRIEREVLAAWDHRHLNLEVPEFAAIIPTTENIAIDAWRRLEPSVIQAGGAQLSRVRVYETPEIFAEYGVKLDCVFRSPLHSVRQPPAAHECANGRREPCNLRQVQQSSRSRAQLCCGSAGLLERWTRRPHGGEYGSTG